MFNMSKAMKAVLMIAEHPAMKDILKPVMDTERDEIRWKDIEIGVLSGGQRTALAWAYAVWTGSQVDAASGMRDPFEGFRSMDRDLQFRVVGALEKTPFGDEHEKSPHRDLENCFHHQWGHDLVNGGESRIARPKNIREAAGNSARLRSV
jgi:hypothetical protein